jgi:hypothetical protein
MPVRADVALDAQRLISKPAHADLLAAAFVPHSLSVRADTVHAIHCCNQNLHTLTR